MRKFKRVITLAGLGALTLPALLASCAENKEKTPETKDVIDELVSDELSIISEPKLVNPVKIPEGFSLEVKVNDESLVKSYQWQINNGTDFDPAWIDLDCESGRTNKLVKPATFSDDISRGYRVIIKDINDNYLFSDVYKVDPINSWDYINCVWICGYKIMAGETFNLATTKLGSGTITFNEKGDEVTLNDVCVDNSNPIYDYYDSNLGFDGLFYNYPYKSFKVVVNGVNTFTNTYWQESENAGGIPFCFNFMDDSKCKNVIFEGDGSLTLCGGSHLIYSNTKVTIGCDMNFGKIGSRYATGVYANEIEVLEGVSIDANLNGFLFQTKDPLEKELNLNGDIYIRKNATINLISSIPLVSVGSTDFHAISGMNNVYIDGAYINMILQGDSKRFDEFHGVGQMIAIQAHEGDIEISNDSVINVLYNVKGKDTIYVLNGCALCSEEGNISISDSTFKVSGKMEYIYNFVGIFACDVTVNRSNVNLDILAQGSVLGLSMQGVLKLIDSDMYVDAKTLTEVIERQSFGLISLGLEMENSILSLKATDVALAISTDFGDEYIEFDDNYEAKVLNDFDVVLPERYIINQWCMDGSFHDYAYFETIYKEGNTLTPASEVLLNK